MPARTADPSSALSLFDALRAQEEPFLVDCYWPPQDFDLMIGMRSALILGETGSGKSALCQAIRQALCPPGQKPRFLVAQWALPVPFGESLAGMALVLAQYQQVLELVARTLASHLGCYPEDWAAAPAWSRDMLHWFLSQYMTAELSHVAQSASEASEEGRALLQRLAQTPAPAIIQPQAAPDLVVFELVKAVRAAGLAGIAVLIDGIERWLAADRERVVQSLHTFLSTLSLFECPGLTYKFLLPDDLATSLGTAGAVMRDRVDWYELEWTEDELVGIVERRLAVALGRADLRFDQLAGPDLRPWIARCGGGCPRAWLQSVRPFVRAYVQEGAQRPISREVCLGLQTRHAPRLSMDLETGEATAGSRRLPPLSGGLETVLRYLYERRGKVCSRRDLYLAYMSASYPEYEPPSDLASSDYAGTMDTVLWRLRQAVEPDPENPVFVTTIKGKGVRLDNAV